MKAIDYHFSWVIAGGGGGNCDHYFFPFHITDLEENMGQ